MTPRPSLLTTSEVAELCQVTPNTVSRWVREGRIAAIALPSGLLRFRREDVEALLTPTTLPSPAGAA
jgi:excisionase family DNA binding protein